jgi:adenylate cyclase class 2
MQEVEQTCEVTPEVQALLFEKLEGREPDRIVVNDDRYYDTASATLYEQAVFVRVRETSETRQLQFKFDEPESDKQHLICTERAFDLTQGSLPDAVHALFRAFLPGWLAASTWALACARNHLQELAHIQNTRHIYQLETCTICLDHVQDVGVFVEVEVMCEEGDNAQVQAAREAVQQFVAEIGGSPLSAGYVELFLQRNKPEIYHKGQYHL